MHARIDLKIPILFHAFMDRERRPDRIIFGTDNCICGGMAKIYNAEITDQERRMIFGENLCKLLTRRGPLG